MFPVQPLQGLFNLGVAAVEPPVSYGSPAQILEDDCQPRGSGLQVSPQTVFHALPVAGLRCPSRMAPVQHF